MSDARGSPGWYRLGVRIRRALLLSLALHAVAVLGLYAVPEPTPPRRSTPEVTVVEWTAIERITAPPPKPPVVVAAPVVDPTAQPSVPLPREEVTTSPTPSAAPRVGRHRNRRSASARAEADELESGADLPLVPDESGGLSLAMRGDQRTDAGRLAPRLRPSGRTRPQPVDGDAIRTPDDAGFVRARGGRWTYRNPEPKAAWTAELLADGRVHFSDPPLTPCRGKQCWLAQKQRLLDRTWDLRLGMAKGFTRKNIERQLRRINRDLLAIWTSDQPPHTRRALIFERWDECEESLTAELGPLDDARSEIDTLRVKAGEQARAAIIEFIRKRVPRDGPDRYTSTELIAMNERRHSTQRFAPYRR